MFVKKFITKVRIIIHTFDTVAMSCLTNSSLIKTKTFSVALDCLWTVSVFNFSSSDPFIQYYPVEHP